MFPTDSPCFEECQSLAFPLLEEGIGYIYYLWDDKRLLYIGKTKNLLARLGSHLAKGEIPFTRCCYREVIDCELEDQESIEIISNSPPYNVSIPPNPYYLNYQRARKKFPILKGKWHRVQKIIRQMKFQAWNGFFHVDSWKEISKILKGEV